MDASSAGLVDAPRIGLRVHVARGMISWHPLFYREAAERRTSWIDMT
jgi:hypothetical protein